MNVRVVSLGVTSFGPNLRGRIATPALAIALVMVLAACQPQTRQAPSPSAQTTTAPAPVQAQAGTTSGPRRIGLLVPLTGRAESVGKDLQRAAEMAVFDFGGPDLQLYPRDTQSSGNGAAAAASALINQEQVQVLIGPLFGASAAQIRPVAKAAGVPVLSFSSQSQVAGDGVYVLGYRPEEQVQRVALHAISQGRTRLAGLAPDDDYGRSAIASLQQTAAAAPSATVVATATYSPSGSDAKAKLEALSGGPGVPPSFDTLVLADGGDRLRRVGDGLPAAGITAVNVQLLGTMLWQNDPTLLQSQGLQGGWYAGMPDQALRGFRNRFRAIYGNDPSPLAILAYDAVGLASIAAAAPAGQRGTALQDPRGFDALAGIIRLKPDGLAERGLVIYQITPGGPRVVDPAPTRFDDGIS